MSFIEIVSEHSLFNRPIYLYIMQVLVYANIPDSQNSLHLNGILTYDDNGTLMMMMVMMIAAAAVPMSPANSNRA